MERIIIHWSAGAHTASTLDLQHYHRVIDGQGRVHKGKHPVSANAGPLRSGQYAAHTLNANTGSIGVAVAAMAGAVERPFSPGRIRSPRRKWTRWRPSALTCAASMTFPSRAGPC